MTRTREYLSLGLLVILGCERTRVTPAAYLVNLQAMPTPAGVDVSFELLDAEREPTLVLFGTGAIRIEEAPETSPLLDGGRPASGATASPGRIADPDTASLAHTSLDSTWLLYNARFIVSREHFTRERRTGQSDGKDRPVCHLGVYPYRHFLRRPRSAEGRVRVAFVAVDGSHVMLAEQGFVWPVEAFGEEIGTRVERFGDR